MDVRTLMRRAVQFNAVRPAIITEDRTLSFAEAWERGCRLANGLIGHGVRPGEWQCASEHLVQHHTQTIDVAPPVEIGRAHV